VRKKRKDTRENGGTRWTFRQHRPPFNGEESFSTTGLEIFYYKIQALLKLIGL